MNGKKIISLSIAFVLAISFAIISFFPNITNENANNSAQNEKSVIRADKLDGKVSDKKLYENSNKTVEKPVDSKYASDGVDYHTAVLTIDKNSKSEKIKETLKPYFSEKNINLALENIGDLQEAEFDPTVSISAKADLSDKQMNDLRSSGAFSNVSRDLKVEFTNYSPTPNDTYNLSDSYSYGLFDFNDSAAPGGSSFSAAWSQLNGSNIAPAASIPIAVLDSGFLPSARDESENIIGKCDFGEGPINCSKKTVAPSSGAAPSKSPNHGTVVSQIISSKTNNGIGGIGASYDMPVYFYKISAVDGSLTTDGIVNGINQAVKDGAKVINMSFGAVCDECSTSGSDAPWDQALKNAYDKGVTLIASAGNGRAKEGYTCHKESPALLDYVISASATDNTGKVAYFSDCNSSANLSAAGSNMRVRTTPSNLELDSDWTTGSGTSYSAPLISAAAGLVLRANYQLTPAQVQNALQSTAHDVTKKSGILGDVCNTDEGVHAGWDECTGWGIMDVNAAMKYVPPPAPEKPPFSDIKNYPESESIVWAYKSGIANGYSCTGYHKPYSACISKSDRVFLPSSGLTRGQMVTFLYRLKGSPAINGAWITPFNDIAGYPERDKIIWAYNAGVTQGTDAKHFSPNKQVNRSQGVLFLYKLAGKPKVTAKNPFTDLSPKSTYYSAAIWASSKGIFSGFKCTGYKKPYDQCKANGAVIFRGASSLTRGQMAKVLNKYSVIK